MFLNQALFVPDSGHRSLVFHGILILLSLLFFSATAMASQSGRDIILEQRERHGVHTASAVQSIELLDRQGNIETRSMRYRVKKMSNGSYRYLLFFTEPHDIRGTALLAWEQKDLADKQWLYLPAMGMLQPISASSRTNKFMGTDFTFEDMAFENPEDHHYEIIGSEFVSNENCYKILAIPSGKQQKKQSGYSKRMIWISKGHLATHKVDFYDKRNNLLKTLTNEDFMVWIPRRSTMRDHQTGHTTIITVTEHITDEPIDDVVFSHKYLLQKMHIQ